MKRLIAIILLLGAVVWINIGGEESPEMADAGSEESAPTSAYEQLNEDKTVNDRPSKITTEYIDIDLWSSHTEQTSDGLVIELFYRVDKVNSSPDGYTYHPDEGHLEINTGEAALPESKSGLLNTAYGDEGMSEGIVTYVFEESTMDDLESGEVKLKKDWLSRPETGLFTNPAVYDDVISWTLEFNVN